MNLNRFWKFALAAGLLTGGAIASSESLALALANTQPELALKLNGNQSVALSNLASRGLEGGSANVADNGRVNAQRVVTINPLDARASAHLAMLFQLDNDEAAATNMMNYAQRISRRNTAAQFWWIEHWAQRGDVAKVLRHYDIALRTSGSAQSTLFPVLVAAVENPIVSQQLALALDDEAVWTAQFVQQFAQVTRNSDAIRRFFLELVEADFGTSELAIATAISRLVDAGSPAQGFELYTAFYREAAEPLIRNANFSTAPHLPTAFDWNLGEAGFYVGLGPDGLELDATNSASGLVASQVVQLTPGAWSVQFQHDGGLAGSERLNLDLVCIGSSVGTQPAPQRQPNVFQAQVRIPSDCPYQKMSILLRSSDSGEALKINRVVLQRL